MSFFNKCFFNNHDWETVNSVREREILESLNGKLAKSRLRNLNYHTHNYPLNCRDGVMYEQKICLKCCAIKDEVAEYIREFNGEKIEIEFEKFQTERRKKQAESMSKSCAADKFVRI